jgi:nicotinamide phosphoribosyltransferase
MKKMMKMSDNVITEALLADYILEELTDAYKIGHWKQYPKNTRQVYSYLESRGGLFPATTFVGLQYYMKKYLAGKVITNESIDEAIADTDEVFGYRMFNEEGFRYIADELGGKLPIEIKAVPEGMTVPVQNVLLTITNTDPKAYWLPNYLEGLIEMIWYPITVGTMSREIKKNIAYFAKIAGEEPSVVHLNNFGFRGSTSPEAAMIGDMAHLMNFWGSDTLPGKRGVNKYYHGKQDKTPTLLSVYAAEHSTVTSYGEENELFAYRELLRRVPADQIASIVIDSYDAMRAVDEYFGKDPELKYLVRVERTGKTVLRPDSGDPVEMSVKVLKSLWNNYGGTLNANGYKVLDPHVGVIYGDYISKDMINQILGQVVGVHQFAPSNILFGMGGALIQKVNRDTQSFAFKCSAVDIDGKWHEVYKHPVTDAKKKSKRGRMALVDMGNGHLETLPIGVTDPAKWNTPAVDILQTVFLNGDIMKDYTFDEVRENAAI